MDVNIWSTFKKGGRSASIASEISRVLPSQKLKQKYESGFSLVNTSKTKPSEKEDIESKVREILDILHKFSELNSLSKEDVHEILDVFETEVFTDENYEYILKRANLLSKYGIIPELVEDETVGGVKYSLRDSPKKKVPFQIPILQTKRRITQKITKVPLKSKLKTIRRLPTLPNVKREEIEIIPEHSSDDKDRILSLIQQTIFEQNSMSKITKLIFEDMPLKIFTEEQGQTYRNIYEISGVESQCNNTIGKFDSLDDNGIRKFPDCYICGFQFYEDKNDGTFIAVERNTKEELRATCEHILPIIQGAFFLELYRPGIDMTNPVIKQQLEFEYSWAHRSCNYEKSDLSFLSTRIQKGKLVSFVFNDRTVSGMLASIVNPDNKRVGLSLLQSQISSKNSWIDGRKIIIKSMMNDIIDYLNSRGNIAFLFLLGYDKITSSERISQKFINAIAEAKQRIQKTKIKLVLDKESGKSISGEIPILVESAYQKSLKRT